MKDNDKTKRVQDALDEFFHVFGEGDNKVFAGPTVRELRASVAALDAQPAGSLRAEMLADDELRVGTGEGVKAWREGRVVPLSDIIAPRGNREYRSHYEQTMRDAPMVEDVKYLFTWLDAARGEKADLGALLETRQAQLDAATEEIARLIETVNETVEAKRNIGNLLALAANEASAFGPGPVHERIFRMREHYEKLLKEARS